MTVTESAPTTTRWTAQWKELYEEVINTGLCTGCAGCVISCPHDVIGYEHAEGKYKPFHLEEELGPSNCLHGEKGCTTCTRACPRFRTWEQEADMHLFGRPRKDDEMYGQYRQLLLVRAADNETHTKGQDGGFVSAMLIWLLENDYIDAALTSFLEGDGSSWKAKPGLARNRAEVLASAGSRYTYSANTLALKEADAEGLQRIALVGMSCQSSVLPVLFLAKYGLKKEEMVKMNIKGVFQIWMKDGSYHEIDLKECHKWTREGCKMCPDFSAEHADISTGGIGESNDWTLCVVRTQLGEEVMNRMIASGVVVARPAQDDATAMKLLKTLSIVSRRRWPDFAETSVKIGVPPPKKKADGAPAAAH